MKKIAFTLLLITLIFSCKKDKKTPLEQLPEATQEGKGTFGCLINGEVFKPNGGWGFSPSLYVDYYNNGIVAIHASNVQTNKDLIFYLSSSSIKTNQITDTSSTWYPIKEPGYFLLSKVTLKNFAAFYEFQSCEYETDSTNIGLLTITNFNRPSLVPGQFITTTPGIVSGTFYFTVKTPGCPDVAVTDGRFDISF